MKISQGIRVKEIDEGNGYGYATGNMIRSLERLGHEVTRNDPSADVEIWFDQPQHWKFSKGPYRIGYHPWESTLLRDDWADIMNQCDEIWTPSPIIADWYVRYSGIKVPVYVYEHGVDPEWTPVDRKVTERFKFLHVGAEAARKGGKETMRAFREEFANNKDVELNMKIISQGWKIGALNKINYINSKMPIEELIQLYHDNHVFVYPSYGEGFGLNPLQAMATGMPTITVPGWAPYARFLDPDLSIDSKFIKTPYPRFHPGMMLKPDFDDLRDAMRYTYDNYETVQSRAQARVQEIISYYDWDRLTKEAFDNLAERL
jgi:glycosyltransferase involved in cell wall biosynthesis